METMPRSRPITSTAAFLLTAAGQLYFLHALLSAGPLSMTPVLAAECFVCFLILAAALFTASSRGWRSHAAGCAAFAVYAAYAVFNLCLYEYFSSLYQSVLQTTYRSYGAAIEAVKLLLPLIGIVAAIPVMPGPAGREYARALEKAAKRQQAGWAGAVEKEAESELERNIKRLRETMSQQELEALAKQLTQGPSSAEESKAAVLQEPGASANEPDGGQTGEEPERPVSRSLTEDWKGWGCG